ncbi:bestrophin family protein [Adhaeribacter terreus]|uniref:Bestrophin family protein n=1 Tax=Adhaeribacter terreus TaxID=529703 RepID=A0ABW0EAH3_9BACT
MLVKQKLPLSYLFNMIKVDVVRVFFFSITFNIFKFFFSDYLPSMPAQLPTVLGTAISLVLAFKLNHSYDRWWEARKIWGSIVNDSRTLILQLKTYIQTDVLGYDETGKFIQKMANRQIGWCYALGESLRGLDNQATIHQYLIPAEAGYVLPQNNKPYAILALHMRDFKELLNKQALNPFQQVQLDSTVSRLVGYMGMAERINSTVFPVTYRVFVHFFIYLFLIILSLGLVETLGPLEIPILIVIASTFFLIEKTATYLQDPFVNMPTDTPVTAIARTIEINIKQLLEEPDVPEPITPEDFYLK